MKKVWILLMMMLTVLSGNAMAQGMDTLARQHGFRMGAALSYQQLGDTAYLELMKEHFSSVTATNEMKAYSLLDQRASRLSEDGMPKMNYTQADRMVAWARENGIGVRGHVLVWDAYMLEWFFHEGYDEKKPYASAEEVSRRTEHYITEVIRHFEEKFPGTVYCWDVVNEAVGDSAGEYRSGDARHLRTMRNGGVNLFEKTMGDTYVEQAFLYARNAVESLGADIRLYYNDYNTFFPEKKRAILALAGSVNSFAQNPDGSARTLMDGIGMQGYIGGYGTQSGCLDDSQLRLIRDAIRDYAALGLEVQITEMAVRNFVRDRADEHAAYYGRLFEELVSLGDGEDNPLKAVSIWGLTDVPNAPRGSYVYKLNSPYGGLFTENLEEKEALHEVMRVLEER